MSWTGKTNWRSLVALVVAAAGGILLLIMMPSIIHGQGGAERVAAARKKTEPRLERALKDKGLTLGSPIFIRIFKESNELEVWIKKKDGKGEFAHFKTYPISNYGSGDLGPKLKEGDGQAPTGFYTVGRRQMNPQSSYHLSFNLGFPNAYDKAKGRTGSFLMVHGSVVSIGCYAMTDALIEEIYLLADAALTKGQKEFSVHAFPFRMTKERLAREAASKWIAEWSNLKEGYDSFEKTSVPPTVSAKKGRYVFESVSTTGR